MRTVGDAGGRATWTLGGVRSITLRDQRRIVRCVFGTTGYRSGSGISSGYRDPGEVPGINPADSGEETILLSVYGRLSIVAPTDFSCHPVFHGFVMCVCVCVFVSVCLGVYVRFMHVFMCIYLWIACFSVIYYADLFVCMCMYIYVCMYLCMYVCISCTYTHTNTHVYVYAQTEQGLCIVCMYVYMYVLA